MIKRLLILFLVSSFTAPALISQPTNDNCSSAFVLCPEIQYSSHTNDLSGIECGVVGDCNQVMNWGQCYPADNTVWYVFKTNNIGGSVTVTVTIINCLFRDSLAGTLMLPATMCDSSSYNVVNCSLGGLNGFTLNGNLNASTEYLVQISGVDSSLCNFDIGVSGPGVVWELLPTVEHIQCKGLDDGQITVSPTGSYSPYSYTWSGAASGNTDSMAENLSAGTYNVTVTDAKLCTKDTFATVLEPQDSLVATATYTNPTCFGVDDGTAQANVSGGISPYQYLWDSGTGSQTSASINGLSQGTYTVTVTDDSLCTDTAIVTLTTPPVLTVIPDYQAPICFQGNEGWIDADSYGGTSPYSYAWSDGSSLGFNTSLVAGTYTVTVTDQNGCDTNATVILTEPMELIATTTETVVNCGIKGTSTAEATGGVSPYSYYWNTQSTAMMITDLDVGTYYLTVTDVNNCSDTSILVITEEDCINSLIPDKAFTPNGDGINDTWNITNSPYFPNMLVYVYNRWGQLVLKDEGYEEEWNGKLSGITLPEGSYFYIIYEDKDDPERNIFKSSVTIIK